MAVFGPSWIAGSSTKAIVTSLAVAWGGVALLVSPLARDLDDPSRLPYALAGQALFWSLAAAVVASVLFWEKQPLRSLWLQPFRWQSIVWGFLLVGAYYTMLFPLGEWVRRAAGLSGFGAGMDQVTRFPVWYRTVAVIGGSIGEEILFRGFSVTRLAMLTGSVWLAALVTVVGFHVLHVPVWGWGFALGGLVSGAAAMAFFIWRKESTRDDNLSYKHRCHRHCCCANVLRMVERTGAVLTASLDCAIWKVNLTFQTYGKVAGYCAALSTMPKSIVKPSGTPISGDVSIGSIA